MAASASPAPTGGRGISAAPTEPSRWRRLIQGKETVITLVGIVLIVFFSLATSAFATTSNLATVSGYIAPILILAVAEVPVLTLGEIDLSVGGVYVLAPFIVVYLNDVGVPPLVGILLTLLIAIGIGIINGLVTVYLKVPSFITTLGMVFALEGIVLLSSNGIQVNPVGSAGLANVLGGWPYSSILWALGIAVVVHIVFRRTTFGLHITATGGNITASAEAGVKVGWVRVACFAICSLLGAFLGVLDGYRISSLNPGTDGLTLMFYGVAAAVVGGTALTGGRGTIIGAVIGAIVLGVLEDGFNIMGINAFAYQLVLGLAILAAMILNIQMDALRAGRRSARLHERPGGPSGPGAGQPSAAETGITTGSGSTAEAGDTAQTGRAAQSTTLRS